VAPGLPRSDANGEHATADSSLRVHSLTTRASDRRNQLGEHSLVGWIASNDHREGHQRLGCSVPVVGCGPHVLQQRTEVGRRALPSPGNLRSGCRCRLGLGLGLGLGALVVVDPRGDSLAALQGAMFSGLPDANPLVLLDLRPVASVNLPRRLLALPAVDECLNLVPRVLPLPATVRRSGARRERLGDAPHRIVAQGLDDLLQPQLVVLAWLRSAGVCRCGLGLRLGCGGLLLARPDGAVLLERACARSGEPPSARLGDAGGSSARGGVTSPHRATCNSLLFGTHRSLLR